MTKQGRQWEECACGSAEAHGRYGVCSTGKTASIYERGGYTVTDAVSRKWEAEVSASFASRPSGPIVGLAATLTPPTPAAMLGEALDLVARARTLALQAYAATPGLDISRSDGAICFENTRKWVESIQREVEDPNGYRARDAARRREQEECDARTGRVSGPATLGDTRISNACWQCDAPLGTTEKCLMCAAKRAEDRARGPVPASIPVTEGL